MLPKNQRIFLEWDEDAALASVKLKNFSECTVRVLVMGGLGQTKIDTLERYLKEKGGNIAKRRQIKSDTFEFQFKHQKGNFVLINYIVVEITLS